MKKYTIKEVVKLENRYDNLKDKSTSDYCTFMGTLSACALGFATIQASYFETHPVFSAITTAGFAVAGGAMFTDMITANARKARLENKLKTIYEVMGKDFECAVWDEKENRTR